MVKMVDLNIFLVGSADFAKGTPLADLVDWHGFPFSETLRHYLDQALWKLRLRSVTDDF